MILIEIISVVQNYEILLNKLLIKFAGVEAGEKLKLRSSILFSFLFVVLLWVVHLLKIIFHLDLHEFGIFPRTFSGMIGIITAPFIHGSFNHLISNSVPLFVLGAMMLYSYPSLAVRVLFISIVVTGIGVWSFARPLTYHIGASGIIYSVVTFLFFSGVFRWDRSSMAIALFVTLFYGSMVLGVFPSDDGISWESHLIGAVSGFVSAFMFKDIDRPPPVFSEEDIETEDDDFIPPDGWKPKQETEIRYIFKEKNQSDS